MQTRLLEILIKTHFIALTIAILNSLLKNFMAYGLVGEIEFGIKILLVTSGLTLFFFYLRPFKKINVYFSIYSIAAILLIVGLIFRGIFGALIISFILFPIIPNDKGFEKNGVVISTPFQGFMARCCSYQIMERQFVIFEKDYGIFESEGPIDFDKIKIEQTKTEFKLTYSTDFEEGIKEKIIKR